MHATDAMTASILSSLAFVAGLALDGNDNASVCCSADVIGSRDRLSPGCVLRGVCWQLVVRLVGRSVPRCRLKHRNVHVHGLAQPVALPPRHQQFALWHQSAESELALSERRRRACGLPGRRVRFAGLQYASTRSTVHHRRRHSAGRRLALGRRTALQRWLPRLHGVADRHWLAADGRTLFLPERHAGQQGPLVHHRSTRFNAESRLLASAARCVRASCRSTSRLPHAQGRVRQCRVSVQRLGTRTARWRLVDTEQRQQQQQQRVVRVSGWQWASSAQHSQDMAVLRHRLGFVQERRRWWVDGHFCYSESQSVT